MELTYTKIGDYYIPDLALDDGAKYEIGVYGRMRERFLKEYHSGTYTSLSLESCGNILLKLMPLAMSVWMLLSRPWRDRRE